MDLADSSELSEVEGHRLFGQISPLSAELDWKKIRRDCEKALGSSHDLRVLAHFAAARVRQSGWEGLTECVNVAAEWLERYPEHVYPRITDDAIERKNALNDLADRMAIVDAVRRLPILESRTLGAVSLRDIEVAQGKVAPDNPDSEPPTESAIASAFAEAPKEALAATNGHIEQIRGALKRIEAVMSKEGTEAIPDFKPLQNTLSQISAQLAPHLQAYAAAAAAAAAEEASASAPAQGAQGGAPAGAELSAPGTIRTREDALRALDAVITYFQRYEPSSPVPLFIERAKRLVAKSFIEVLEDVVPDALSEVRRVTGVSKQE